MSDPQVDAAITQWYEDLLGREADKLDGYVNLIHKLEMEAVAAKAHVEQRMAKAKSRVARADWLRSRLLDHMIRSGKTKLTTASGVDVKVIGHGGLAPLHVAEGLDLDAIDPEFVRTRKELDKEAVRQAIGAGRVLPFANLLPRGKRVEFK